MSSPRQPPTPRESTASPNRRPSFSTAAAAPIETPLSRPSRDPSPRSAVPLSSAGLPSSAAPLSSAGPLPSSAGPSSPALPQGGFTPQATLTPIPDTDNEPALPLTMGASVVLTALPRDARTALEGAGREGPAKVTIHFHALLHAPTLKQTRFKITASQPFDAVVQSLRKKLKLRESEGVWCYVGNFSPGGDEGVGGLWKCFKTGDELTVGYSITPAFG